jgi:hypothetical protein
MRCTDYTAIARALDEKLDTDTREDRMAALLIDAVRMMYPIIKKDA